MSANSTAGEINPTVHRVFCYRAVSASSAGVWLGDNPLDFSLPLLLYQLIIIFVFTRITHSILRHLNQPQVISQIIAGMLLGPSFLGRKPGFERLMISMRSWEQLNTVASLAFLLFLFQVGVKTDLGMIRQTGKKAVAIAIFGTGLPFLLIGLSVLLYGRHIPGRFFEQRFLITLATKWSVTSYTVLSCTLSELNLLTSKIGRLAMSASLIADFVNLFWSAFFNAFTMGFKDAYFVLISAALVMYVAFGVFIGFVARPAAIWFIRKTPEGALLDERCFVAVVLVALLCSIASEAIGFHASMGAFLLGLMLPGGAPLGVTLVERLDRLMIGVFLPVFVAQAGLRMDLASLADVKHWGYLELFIALCVVGKFVGAFLVCLYCKMSTRDALSLSLIMINKGIFEVDAANSWQDAEMIDQQLYTIVILNIIFFGGGTAPLVKCLYRPEDSFIAYKRRTIQHAKRDAELRILACIHSQEDVTPTLALLESSNPSPESPIGVYVLHLIQLAGRAAAVLAPHKRHKTSAAAAVAVSDTDHIANAFHFFEQQNPGRVSALPYVCCAPYASMHEDICSLALDKKAALVVVPFHKRAAQQGVVESTNPAVQAVNLNVLQYAPCSVGILIDHGLAGGMFTPALASGGSGRGGGELLLRHIAVYFFGGADDREALAYAMRMAEDRSIGLTVVRFCPPKEWRQEDKLDEQIVEDFRAGMADGSRVVYVEEVVKDGEGTVAVIRTNSPRFNLLIVGRRDGRESPLTAGLSVWNEYPELGIVGDLLASTDFGGNVSILVVQQQTRVGKGGREQVSPRSKGAGRVVPRGDDDDKD